MNRTSVVIADDNEVMRALLRGILRGHDYEVLGEANNGAAAVDLASRLKPDIVCLDVMMPALDGLSALREIRAAQPASRVVMVTGDASATTVQEAIGNGASGYIVKPFNAAKVLDTLDRITGRKSR